MPPCLGTQMHIENICNMNTSICNTIILPLVTSMLIVTSTLETYNHLCCSCTQAFKVMSRAAPKLWSQS